MWVHDKEASGEDCIRQRGAKNLSVERHYYSVDLPEGGRDAGPERLISKIEDKAARVIRSLCYGADLSWVGRNDLALFVASMKFRVSGFRPWLDQFAQRYARQRNRHLFPNVKSLRDYFRAKESPLQEMPEVIEQLFAYL